MVVLWVFSFPICPYPFHPYQEERYRVSGGQVSQEMPLLCRVYQERSQGLPLLREGTRLNYSFCINGVIEMEREIFAIM